MTIMRGVGFSLVLALGACGDDGVKHLADAPPGGGDAAAGGDARRGTVTLTITGNHQPIAGARVEFVAPDGTTSLGTVATTPAGVASLSVPAGSSVTVVDPYGPDDTNPSQLVHDLRTWLAVQPGDQLVLDYTPARVPVTFAAESAVVPNATSYEVASDCGHGELLPQSTGSGSPTVVQGELTFYTCGATTDVLVEAFDDDDILLASYFMPAVAITDGATLDWTAQVPVAAVADDAAYTNVPGDSVGLVRSLVTAKGHLDDFAVSGAATGGSAGLTMTSPAAPAGIFEVDDASAFNGVHTVFHVVDWHTGHTASSADFSNHVTKVDDPAFDPAAHHITWTQTTTVTIAVDYAAATTSAIRATSGAGVQAWTWKVAGPSTGGTTLAYPVLPTIGGDYNIADGDAPGVRTLDAVASPGGYDAVRPFVLSDGDVYAHFATTGTADRALVSSFIADPAKRR